MLAFHIHRSSAYRTTWLCGTYWYCLQITIALGWEHTAYDTHIHDISQIRVNQYWNETTLRIFHSKWQNIMKASPVYFAVLAKFLEYFSVNFANALNRFGRHFHQSNANFSTEWKSLIQFFLRFDDAWEWRFVMLIFLEILTEWYRLLWIWICSDEKDVSKHNYGHIDKKNGVSSPTHECVPVIYVYMVSWCEYSSHFIPPFLIFVWHCSGIVFSGI